VRARPTELAEELECGLVFRSIGYKGVGLDGIPFDQRRGVIPNQGGRVSDPQSGQQVAGQYAVGWIKRGPSGVIGTNKKDAQETIDNLLADLEAGRLPAEAADSAAVESWLVERVPEHVAYSGWEAIDRAEQERGRPLGRPRVKFVRIEDMIEAARSGDPVAS
jgi:ferredoxin/flavodoxin---NADP+ reductase